MENKRILRRQIEATRWFTNRRALGLALLLGCLTSQAVPPPTGVAPVVVPAGGFNIDGDLIANTPSGTPGDWLPDANGLSGVLDASGNPLNPATTFHFIDPFNSGSDNTFTGGKWTDDPNTWGWTTSKASAKTDINNVLLHVTTDANGHSWVVIAGDRLSNSGDSYIDFEFLQNPLFANADGTFSSAGSQGGRTLNDLILTLVFTSGGSFADFYAFRWQASGGGAYTYVDATASLPTGRVFVAANGGTTSVPYGAFGLPSYSANAFAEAAIDLTALLGNFNPCLSVGFSTVLVKTKVSQSGPSTISDFINPIQYTLRIGPSAYAGPDQTKCSQGTSTAFSLNGQATQGLQPLTSTNWSVVAGSATMDNPGALSTTAHVSSSSATLRLTVTQSNGCTETNDVVLTVTPIPNCSIAGAASVFPLSTSQFSAPPGMSACSWSISGNGTISGSTKGQTVSVTAGATCGNAFTLTLNLTNNSCSSTCTWPVAVGDGVAPSISAPADRVLECPADTRTNNTGMATATDDSGHVTISYSDTETAGCGPTKTISRLWRATDLCGNSADAVQLITVQDTKAPVVKAPANVTISCSASLDPAVNGSLGVATATDGCSSASTPTYADQTIAGSCASSYTIKRTWSSTDACGNVGTASQTITVQDTTAPTLAGVPANVTAQCSAIPVPATPTATDGCDSNPSVSLSETSTQDADATKLAHYSYTITRTWTATDACGNHSSQSQVLTVQDTTAPTLSGQGAPQTISCPATPNFTAPTASDNCDPNPVISHTDVTTPGSCAGNYSVTRTWTAKDVSGNTSTAVSQTITVQDVSAPTLAGVPANLTVECSAIPAPATPTATDGCDSNPSVSLSETSTQDADATALAHYSYTLTRTWTATDACGNHSSQSQGLTVQDTTAPTLSGQGGPQTISCPATPVFTAPKASDNCDPNPVISHTDVTTPGSCAGNYSVTRTWTAKDVSGNTSASVSQTITVQDASAPTLAGVPANVTVQCSAIPAPATPTATDGCDSNPSVSLSETSTQDADATKLAHYSYTITRTWTATDACGNHSSQTQVITVKDTTAPTLSGQGGPQTISCPATPSFTAPTASDNCDPNPVISYTDVTSPGSCAGNYSVTRTWSAKDVGGNTSASVSQTITVQDISAPTLAGVPANETVECSAIPAPATPTATDGCDSNPSVSLSETSTQDADATKLAHYSYTITRTWTATDACGNHSSQSQVITVKDTTAPTLSGQGGPQTISCPATPSFTAPTASDNCDPSPVISHIDVTTPGFCAGNYSVTRTWTAKDVSGNTSASVSQRINVQDVSAPTLAGVPANVTVQCSVIPAPATPTATDGCDSNPSVSLSESSTQDADATKLAHFNYAITRTWTATDACGNHSSQSQVITVKDTTAPTLSGQGGPQTISCPATPSFTAPTASDNCDPNPVISYTDVTTPGSCAGNYSVTRTWTANDVSGNASASVSQIITVQDVSAPTLAGVPANVTVQCSVIPAPATPTATDGCDSNPSVNLSETSTQDADATKLAHYNYTITRTWTATDACANHASQSQVITVKDTTAPTLSGQGGPQTISCPATPVFTAPKASDNCDPNPVISYTDVTTPGSCAGNYSVTRTWTAKDVSGNASASVSQIITVQDVSAPTLAGVPANVTVQCSAIPAPATPTATDGCDSNSSVGLTETSTQDADASKLAHYSYTITRTWTATDACGNHSSQTQVITVKDTTAPTLSGQGGPQTISCPATPSFTAPKASDNCDPNPVITYTDVTTPGSCAGNYSVTRTWTAKDVSGNTSASVSQTITVQDVSAPTLAGVPANVTVQCSAIPAPATPTATDGCDPNPSVNLSETSTQDADATKLAHYNYTITRTWAATDACGNHSSQSQVITVQDTTAPTLSGQGGPQTISCPAIPVFTAPKASDNCDPNPVISYADVTTPGSCAGNYSVTRTWTAKDVGGNASTPVSQIITVQDVSAPTLAGVPANMTVQCSAIPAPATPTATDGCDSNPSLSLSESSTQDADVTRLAHYSYTITRTWTATDSCGNHASQSQVITVKDTTAPTLSGQGGPQTISCPATPVFTAPMASDNCDPNPVITYTDVTTPGSCAGNYSVTRTWTAKDVSGNASASVSQIITVQDVSAPTLAGVPANVTVECSAIPAPATPTAADGCDSNPKVTLVETSTQVADVTKLAHYSYTITRTWTATDACGNHSSQSQVITVKDTTTPTLTGQGGPQTISCPATPSFTAPKASDNCDPNPVITFTDVTTPGSCAGNYSVTRTWTAKDVSGNVSTPISQTITVQDNTPPVISGVPANVTVQCSAVAAPANPTATDCDPHPVLTLVETSTQDADVTKPGHYNYTITRTWTATDACGNHSSQSQVITVQDTTPPVLSGQGANQTIQCPNTPVFTAPRATDNCDPSPVMSFSDVTKPGACAGGYSVTRTWTAKDVNGNLSAPVSQTVTVTDTTAPLITCPSNAIVDCALSLDPTNTGPATAIDNCDSNVRLSYVDTYVTGSQYNLKLYAAEPDPNSGPYDPTYLKLSPGNLPPPASALTTGRAADPLRNAVAYGPTSSTLDALTSMGSANLCFGQVVPFEAVIQASGAPGPEHGTIEFTASWATYTTSNNRFGYDTNYMVYAAFVDYADAGSYDQFNNARVESYHSSIINQGTPAEAIQGIFRVSGLEPGDQVVVEIWVVLMPSMPKQSGGTIAASLDSAQKLTTPPEPISTGVQTTSIGNLSKINPLPAPQPQPPLGPLPPVPPPSLAASAISMLNRTWTATDVCGNGSSCVQQITVIDRSPPALRLPADLVLECPADTSTNSTGVATAQDACGSSFMLSYSDTVSNACGVTKVISRRWTAIDSWGNTTNAVQTITVRDTKAPIVTAPANITLACGSSLSPTVNTALGVATAQDGCSTASTPTYADQIVPGTCAANYTVQRTWSSQDICGNVGSAIQTITVRDTVAPAVTAPANRTIACGVSLNPAVNTALGVATATDGCSGASTPTYSDQIVPGNCSGNYVIRRTWSVQDGCGNIGTALQTITVQDTTAPVITSPANLVLAFTADTSPSSTGVATATDTCSAVSLSYSDAVTVQNDGTRVITRTWTATDTCGNHASASQSITLDSPSAPVLPTQHTIVLSDLAPVTVTNTATNPNSPANPLTYQLLNPPAGASIDANGIITWTPTLGQSPSTNLFTTVVTTTVSSGVGTSTVSATNSFLVIVSSPYDGINLSDPDQALADNDGDSLSNLLEYSVGSDPNNSADASSGLVVWITQDNGSRYLAMKFKRRTNAAALGLQYAPEVSADKASWLGDGANVQLLDVSPLDSQFDWVTVRDLTTITPAQARFVHLRVVSGSIQTVSPTWVGTATTLQGASGSTAQLSVFSQRMVLPIQYAGVVSSLQTASLVDTNANWGSGQFGGLVRPAYAEFNNGMMVDITDTSSSSQSLSLAGGLSGVAAPGDVYRVRQHFTIASLFGTNNETGLKPGLNPSQADTILLQIPQTGSTMTIFYFSNAVVHGWYRADYTPAANQAIYPEQGVMVRRVAAGNVNVYACGPVKTGVTVAPIEPGYNLVGTLKSLSSVTLSQLNLYTGSPATGLASGLNPSAADTLVVIQPTGGTATYFYFKNSTLQGWYSALFQSAGNTVFAPGSAFYIERKAANGPFNWAIPAEQ